MVMTSTGNVTSFDKIKEVLVLQHSRIHMKAKGERKGKSKGHATWHTPIPYNKNTSPEEYEPSEGQKGLCVVSPHKALEENADI